MSDKNIESNLLTGIRDLDREIVNKLSDTDLLNMCGVNQTYWERFCDDSYFRLRTEARFPETVHYKDYRTIRSWKNHYLNIVKYINLLQLDFQYIYKSQDKSPELLYLARQVVHQNSYNQDIALIGASSEGDLSVVKYLVEHGADINAHDNNSVIYASVYGHLPVVKYLVEHGADIHTQDNAALVTAKLNKNIKIEALKYLEDYVSNIYAQDNAALLRLKINKHVKVIEYLESLQ